MKFSNLFITAVKPETVKSKIVEHYNSNYANAIGSKELTFSTFTRWYNTRSENLTKVGVLKSIKAVTLLEDHQIFEAEPVTA